MKFLLIPAALFSGAVSLLALEEHKPGEVVSFDFPDLVQDHNGQPATCKIRLPDNYDPAKPMPLLLWFGGGKGSSDGGQGRQCVDTAEFAVAGMPYPSNLPRPADAVKQRKMREMWNYHRPMVERLFETFPNIDPKLRFAGGMSNGAHVVGSYLADGHKEFIDNFHAYILIEGGAQEVRRIKVGRRPVYMAWGMEPGNTQDYMLSMLQMVKQARMNVTTQAMAGVGHGFPGVEQQKVREWVEQKAIPILKGTTGAGGSASDRNQSNFDDFFKKPGTSPQ